MLLWYGNKLDAKLKRSIMEGIRQGAFLLESEIKKSMRKGGRTESGEITYEKVERTYREGRATGVRAGLKVGDKYLVRRLASRKDTHKINTFRSKPGEVPRVQSGTLRRSITHDFTDLATAGIARVGTNVEYGKWLEFGIPGGKLIYPKRKRVLRWFSGGKAVFARRVRQGAIKPRPFMRPAVQKTQAFIGQIMGAAARGELAKG